jgi:hypothetical protein
VSIFTVMCHTAEMGYVLWAIVQDLVLRDRPQH